MGSTYSMDRIIVPPDLDKRNEKIQEILQTIAKLENKIHGLERKTAVEPSRDDGIEHGGWVRNKDRLHDARLRSAVHKLDVRILDAQKDDNINEVRIKQLEADRDAANKRLQLYLETPDHDIKALEKRVKEYDSANNAVHQD